MKEYKKTIQNHGDVAIKVGLIMRKGRSSTTEDYGTTWTKLIAAKEQDVVILPDANHGDMPYLNGLEAQDECGAKAQTVRISSPSDPLEKTVNANHTLVLRGFPRLEITGENPYLR